jgi:hypothetical protein
VKGLLKLPKVLHRIAAVAAILALLLPTFSVLTEIVSADNLPACCNTAYCPLHHRQMSDVQKDKSLCGAMGASGTQDCSMRACDSMASPLVGSALFVLITPIVLRAPTVAEATPTLAFQHFPFLTATPLTPPPQFPLG